MHKVLFITNFQAPYRVLFFEELGRLCDLTVAYQDKPENVTHRNIAWFNTDCHNHKIVFLKSIIRLKIKGKTIAFAPSIIGEIKKKYDYIIIGDYSIVPSMIAIRYMKRHHINYIINTDGAIKKNGKGLTEKIKYYLISNASGYLSPNSESTEYFCFYGAKKEAVFSYNFTSLKEEDIRKRILSSPEKRRLRDELNMHISDDSKVLLSVGQFIYRKGFDLLIIAMSKVSSSIHLYIVGGTPTEEYKKLVRDLNLKDRVHFVTHQSKKEIFSYMDAADIFVHPTRKDIWGLVINEAMARGLPIITTNACGAGKTLIASENGELIPSNNIDDLAKAINRLASSPDLDKISNSNIKKIKDYTIENMAKRHMDILKKLPKAYYE